MGCKQVKILPTRRETKNEQTQIEPIEAQVTIVQPISTTSETNPIVVYRNPLNELKRPTIVSVISNKSDEPIEYPKSTTPKTLNLDNCHDTNNKNTPSKFGETSLIPIHSNEVLKSRENISRSSTMNSYKSNIPDDSSVSIASNEPAKSPSIYRPSFSSSDNSEIRAHGQDAILRFISARPNRITNQESTHHGNWSEHDESYSPHDSIISTISADSEGSVVDEPRGTKTLHIHPKKSNLQQKILPHDPSSDSDGSELHHVTDTNSPKGEVKVMTKHLICDLRSVSAKLSNPDPHLKGIISETTTSESDEK
ncbi:unnamed protein product [Adineta steineri]|uniref:Uncharacterized protein n=1 Tax=Adineta steineri TaxID=433720 RepID=A0A818JAZ6_9BILA|nr:unnamed protein product [Adineta steineri]CAF3536412.1 unnamed protein product [Adineta steineri]CAF3641451.1 unnamed protein product [Adineta steineri]